MPLRPKLTLQNVFDACEKLDDEIYALADAARMRIDPEKYPSTLTGNVDYAEACDQVWEAARDAGLKERAAQIATLQQQCGEVAGHVFERHTCMVCGANRPNASATSDANLLKVA